MSIISVELEKIYSKEKARIASLSDEHGDYMHPVFGTLAEHSDVVFIGEAPGANEVIEGRPFVGKAGKQLDDMLRLCGIDRTKLFVTNAVKYRPWKETQLSSGKINTRNRTPSVKEIRDSSVSLFQELCVLKPKIVVTLGNSPLKSVQYVMNTKLEGEIGALHGQAIQLASNELSFTLFALYHPASGIYNRELVKVMEDDLLKLADFSSEILY